MLSPAINRRRGLLTLLILVSGLALIAGQLWTGSVLWILSWAMELALAGAVLLAGWAFGRRLLGLIWPGGLQRDLSHYTSLGLGLGAMAAFVFVLGSLGLIGRLPLSLLVVAGSSMGLVELAPFFSRWLLGDAAPDEPFQFLEKAILVLPFAAGLLYATLPVIFYDAVVYHLGLPNLYLASGSLVYPEAFSLAGYPQNAELILTVAMALGGEAAAHLTGYLLTFLAALTMRRIIMARFGRLAGNFAYLLLVSQWFFWFQAIFLMVDMIGAFFLLAGIAVILDAPEEAGYRPWIVGGLLVGLALGVKFANLLPAVLAVLILPVIVHSVSGGRWKHGLVMLILAAGVVSPWLVRNMIHRGNPLFPAFYSQLGGAGWTADHAAQMRAETGMDLERSLMASAKRLGSIGWRPGYGSGGELSRAWIPLLLAGLLFSADRRSRLWLGLAAVSLMAGVVFFTSYLRVFSPALLLVPIATAVLWERFRHGAQRVVLGLAFAAVVIPGLIFSAGMSDMISGGGRRVFLGAISPRDYLSEQLGYTPVARYINDNLELSARIRIIGSARSAYIHRVCVSTYVWDDPWIAPLIDDPLSGPRMTQELRDDGFTHVLLDTVEMDRLENSQGLYRYKSREGGRDGIDSFLEGLTVVVEANGVYLFSIPAG